MLLSGIQPFTLLDYPNKVSCIIFTPGCNFRCSFCHNPEFVIPEKVATLRASFIEEEAFFNFLDQRKTLLDGVVISGGEPTLMPDLEAFIAKIKERGLLVKLDSNGNRPEVLSSLISKKMVDYIAMDIKTSLPNHKGLVGQWVVEKNIIDSIALLKQGSIPYEFRTTLIKEVHPSEVLDAMVEMIKGATHWYLQPFRPEVTLDPAFMNMYPFDEAETKAVADRYRPLVQNIIIR